MRFSCHGAGLTLVTLLLAGCAGPEPAPPEPAHKPNPAAAAVIAKLGDPDAATRDAAEAELRRTGFAALREIWGATAAESDPEIRERLLRVAADIECDETRDRLLKSWADQQFVLRRGGKLAGTERDIAAWDGGWIFRSTVVLTGPDAPTVSVEMLANCRDDASLTPDRTEWTSRPGNRRVVFLLQDQQVTRVVSSEDAQLPDFERPDLWLEYPRERPQTLAANVSRLVERASLVRRDRIEVDAWTCASGAGPRRRTCVIEYRETATLVVGGSELTARRYVEISPPRTDEYWVNDRFGLVRAKIGGYEMERSFP